MIAKNCQLFVFIGDIHGYVDKLQSLWGFTNTILNKIEKTTKTNHIDLHVNIWFLGDYCDRGPHTNEVFSTLLSLPIMYPKYAFRFLRGNHDQALEYFLQLDSQDYSDTIDGYIERKGHSVLYSGIGSHTMHLQGRRYAGRMNAIDNSIYQSASMIYRYEWMHICICHIHLLYVFLVCVYVFIYM